MTQTKDKLTPGELIALRRMASADPTKAGPAWQALSEAQTAVAAERTGGMPLTVVTAPDAPGGPPGVCAVKAARIMLDGNLLPCSPDRMDTDGNPEHFRAMARIHGVLVHECGHAVHTPEERPQLRDLPDDVLECVTLLEELRMEAQVIRHRPSDSEWLRASSKDIIMGGGEIQDEYGAFSAAVLIEGRVPAGTLRPDDTKKVHEIISEHIPADIHTEILDICRQSTNIADDDIDGLIVLGRELAKLRPQTAGGSLTISVGDGEGSLADAIGDAISEALDADEGELSDEAKKELEELLGDKEAREEIAKALQKQSAGAAGSADGSAPASDEREATPEERQARNQLHAQLRKVRWRERTSVRTSSALPPGRLRTREALRRSAERDMGKMPTAKPWKSKKRRNVELPLLTCGLLLDTSGSMGGHEEAMAGSLWALAHAVHDNGGKVAASLFGNASETIFPSGAPPRHVKRFQTTGGTEHIKEGIELLGRELGWEKEEGPRLLVIVSDGYWWSSGGEEEAIRAAQEQGILVLQVGIGREPQPHGEDETLVISSAGDLAGTVGATAVRELKYW